jgi:glyoxylase-like metal-dependent hydrolase (beta-lactamase superfamily II)
MANFAEWYGLSPDDVDDEIRPLPIPVQSTLIKQADITLLVDAPRYDIIDNSPFAILGYEPPPGLVAQLAQVGTLPDEVTHVVITHPHFDHFNGLTVQKNDEFTPVLMGTIRHGVGVVCKLERRIQ